MSSTKPGCDPAREQQETPATLGEAHDLLRRLRPEWEASDEEWAAFYRHCVEVLAETAKIDKRHRDEAMMWAELCWRHAAFAMARVLAQKVEDELDPDLAGDDR